MSDGQHAPYAFDDKSVKMNYQDVEAAGEDGSPRNFGYTQIIEIDSRSGPAGSGGTHAGGQAPTLQGPINLPLPNEFSVNMNAEWTSGNVGILTQSFVVSSEAGLSKLFGGGKDAEWDSTYAGLSTDLINLGGKFVDKTGEVFKNLLSGLSGNGADAAAWYNQRQNKAVNEGEVLLFKGHKIESFTLNFTITPRSKEESEGYARAIKTLMIAASANLQNNKMYWTIPNSFRIWIVGPNGTATDQYGNGGDPNMTGQSAQKIGDQIVMFYKPAFKITSINTNFTPSGGIIFHHDSYPVTYTLTISGSDANVITQDHRKKMTFMGYKGTGDMAVNE